MAGSRETNPSAILVAAARACAAAFINFDVSDSDVEHFERDCPEGEAFRRRLADYTAFLVAIGQQQVLDTIVDKLASARAKLKPSSGN